MKKTIAVRPPAKTFRPKKVGKARQKLARGGYDDPKKVDKMLDNRVLDKIIDDLNRGNKAA